MFRERSSWEKMHMRSGKRLAIENYANSAGFKPNNKGGPGTFPDSSRVGVE